MVHLENQRPWHHLLFELIFKLIINYKTSFKIEAKMNKYKD